MSENLIKWLAKLAEELRTDNEGSLEGLKLNLEVLLYEMLEVAELTPEQKRQVLSSEYERLLETIV